MIASALGIGVAAAVGSIAAVASIGAFHRNSWVFGPAVGRLPGNARNLALTFDDGPSPTATPAILDTLREENVRATFFLLGRHVDCWPDLARRIAGDGHALGNHGYDHQKLHTRGPAYIRRDLERGTAAIERATGKRPALFRAPHGFRNPWVTPIARSLGQTTVGWTLGVWDSDRPGAAVITDRAMAGAAPGTILLLHDGDGCDVDGDRRQTAEALPQIIRRLRDQGYRFVGLLP